MPTGANQDELLAAAIASGKTYAEAGKLLDKSEYTVLRRMKEPAFRDLVAGYRQQIIEQMLGLLCKAGSDAVARIVLVMDNPTAKDGDQLKAAALILSNLRGFSSDIDLAEKLTKIEADIAEMKGTNPAS